MADELKADLKSRGISDDDLKILFTVNEKAIGTSEHKTDIEVLQDIYEKKPMDRIGFASQTIFKR